MLREPGKDSYCILKVRTDWSEKEVVRKNIFEIKILRKLKIQQMRLKRWTAIGFTSIS